MGPSFAESPIQRRFVWLFGTACASVLALVAMRPCPEPATRLMKSHTFERFEHQPPVKKCVDGRWVYAHPSGRSHQHYVNPTQ